MGSARASERGAIDDDGGPVTSARAVVGNSLQAIRLRIFVHDFLHRAMGGADTPATRREIASRFREVHRHVPCAHQEAELLIVAEAILTSPVAGPVVELGCYLGGSTAKLSLACRHTGRRLIVCDSFEGLPVPGADDEVHRVLTGRVKRYEVGAYRGTLETVRENVRTWGAIECCEFVPGLYEETLPKLDLAPAVVFEDADLIRSGRTVFEHLWPRMPEGAKLFTHEASVDTFTRAVFDPVWWHKTLGECPPMLYGAGYGFGQHAVNLGWCQKR